MKTSGLKKAKEIFLYSASEPNELLIAMCHIVCLPMAIHIDFITKNYFLAVLGVLSGFYQLYSVMYNNRLKVRLIAAEIATVIALGTVLNLSAQGLLNGSRTGWIIILAFAIWNTVRILIELVRRNG